MTDVRIAGLRRRYRLPAGAEGERARIDRVVNAALGDDVFDAALERAGISASDEVCIRQVSSVVRLHATHDDTRLAVACSVAIADAIAAELAAGGPNVVRFSSRRHALNDMALSVAAGNLVRVWAWRRLDLWRGDTVDSLRDAERELFAALARHAGDAPYVLATVGDAGLLRAYIVNVPVSDWITLANAVLAKYDAMWRLDNATLNRLSDDTAERVGDENDGGSNDDAHGGDATFGSWLVAFADRIRHSSRLLSAVRGTGARISPTLSHSLAALAVVECEPAMIGSANGYRAVRVLEKQLTRDHATPTSVAPEREASRATERTEPFDTRVHLATRFGGLLFLLHAVRAIDVPARIAMDDTLRARSRHWVLHELAVVLVQQAVGDAQASQASQASVRTDAATYVFAGIVAGSQRGGAFAGETAANARTLEESVTAVESTVLQTIVSAIVTWIRNRGGALAEEEDTAMLARIITRDASIVADASWIEVRFSVSDTSTDIRRAGLDIDLGWLPWLGMVVRFAYA